MFYQRLEQFLEKMLEKMPETEEEMVDPEHQECFFFLFQIRRVVRVRGKKWRGKKDQKWIKRLFAGHKLRGRSFTMYPPLKRLGRGGG